MVTPQQILTLAEELAERDDEAAIRCAISRAYYAAFLHCRIWLENRGQSFDRRGRDHRDVQQGMAVYDRLLAERLRYLRIERNSADYDIAEPKSSDVAKRMCDAAALILALLDSSSSNTTN